MYFILKTTVDETQQPIGFDIVNYTNKTISTAIILLETSVRAYIKEECGKQAAIDARIIDIHNLDQAYAEVDGMLIYRLGADSQTLHVFQRKTVTVPGKVFGYSLVPTFRRVQIFTLLEKPNISSIDTSCLAPVLPQVEMVAVGPARIKIPKIMTMAPMIDVIEQLKKSAKFQKCFEMLDTSKPANPIKLPVKNIPTAQPVQTKQNTPEVKYVEAAIKQYEDGIESNQITPEVEQVEVDIKEVENVIKDVDDNDVGSKDEKPIDLKQYVYDNPMTVD